MRNETQVLGELLGFAETDARIRLVGMEGSRTNPSVPADIYRDYDLSLIHI